MPETYRRNYILPDEKPMDVAEDVIRDIMLTRPDKPIRAKFYRGLHATPSGLRPAEEIVETPSAADGWFVHLSPGLDDVAICAMEPTPFGPDIIGRRLADCLDYPTADNEAEAIAGPDFRQQLLAAIDEKIAVIKAARA